MYKADDYNSNGDPMTIVFIKDVHLSDSQQKWMCDQWYQTVIWSSGCRGSAEDTRGGQLAQKDQNGRPYATYTVDPTTWNCNC